MKNKTKKLTAAAAVLLGLTALLIVVFIIFYCMAAFRNIGGRISKFSDFVSAATVVRENTVRFHLGTRLFLELALLLSLVALCVKRLPGRIMAAVAMFSALLVPALDRDFRSILRMPSRMWRASTFGNQVWIPGWYLTLVLLALALIAAGILMLRGKGRTSFWICIGAGIAAVLIGVCSAVFLHRSLHMLLMRMRILGGTLIPAILIPAALSFMFGHLSLLLAAEIPAAPEPEEKQL